MESKKEHVKAHNYVARRLTRSILTGRPDHWEPLYRRSFNGTMIGLLLALLIVIGFLVYGLINPGKGPGLNPGTNIVIEKETGTRYLVQGDTLFPVANLASALLAVGPKLQVQSLSQKKTALLRRGRPVGLTGAPESVPKSSGVVKVGWAACIEGTTSTSGVVPPLKIDFTRLSRPPSLPTGDGLLVANPSGQVFIVANGTRHQMGSTLARSAAGYAAVAPLRVPDAWLASLKPGRSIVPLSVPGVGEDGPTITGRKTKVGQIIVTRDATAEAANYLVQRQTVIPITPFEAKMLLGNPELDRVNGDSGPLVLTLGRNIGATKRVDLPQSQDWPAIPPRPVKVDGAEICVAANASGTPWVGLRDKREVPAGSDTDVVLSVPVGSGVLAEAVDPAGGRTGRLTFIDEQGIGCTIGESGALAALGLDTAARVQVPVGLLSAIPAGPALSVSAVRGPVA